MNPLLIKGLCCLLGVAAAAAAITYGPGLMEGKKETAERAENPEEKRREDGVDEVEETANTMEQNQCSHAIDGIAKSIRSIFLTTYLEGDWNPKDNGRELSEADRSELEKKKVEFENWKNNTSSKCRNHSNIGDSMEKILEFLKDPKVSEVGERFRTPMKEVLREVGSSSGESY